jgi:hypothetical protein
MQKDLINYRYIPVKKWSKLLNIKWSFDLENPIYNPHREESYYGKDTRFIAGWVSMDELFYAIPEFQQLRGRDIWSRGVDRINRVIDFWKNGGEMTPPLIDTSYNFLKAAGLHISLAKDGIIMRAGFHRFSVCCLVGLVEIPFFTPEKSRKDIEAILKTVRWI